MGILIAMGRPEAHGMQGLKDLGYLSQKTMIITYFDASSGF